MADGRSEHDEESGGRPIPPGAKDPYDRLFEQFKEEFAALMRSAPRIADFTPISEPTFEEAHRAWEASRHLMSDRMAAVASEVDRVVGEFKDGRLSEEQLKDEIANIVAKG